MMDTDYQELGQHGVNRRRKTILGIAISLMLVGLVAMPIVMQNTSKKPTTMSTESGPMLAPALFSAPKSFREGAITEHLSTQIVAQNHPQAKASAEDAKTKTSTKFNSNALRTKPCNESLTVKGAKMPLPARGFITCCDFLNYPPGMMAEHLLSYLAAGGRLIDTAPDYGYESVVGEAVRKSGIPRENLWLTSKVDTDQWMYAHGSAKDWAIAQVDRSLHTMGLSYLDSMVLHFGPAQLALQQPWTTVGPALYADMWRGLIEAKRLGKVRHIGVCETTRHEIEGLISKTGETPAIILTWYNPFTPAAQDDYISWAKSQDIAVLAYGLYNFKEMPEIPTPQFGTISQRMGAAEKIAKRYNVTYGQVATKWALDRGVGFVTHMSPWYLQEDLLQCPDFEMDDADNAILASAAWPCDLTKFEAIQYLPGCIA